MIGYKWKPDFDSDPMKILIHTVVVIVAVFVAVGANAQTTQMNVDREFTKATQAFANKDYVTAAQIFKELSEQDDFNSQYNYALLLQKGVGTPKDLKQALYWAWRARINGVDPAIDLTADIAEFLSNKELEDAQSNLLEALMDDAKSGSPAAISGVATTFFYVKENPDYEDGYTWALVAQALGQNDVSRIIKDAEKTLGLDAQLSCQKEASELFQTILQSESEAN